MHLMRFFALTDFFQGNNEQHSSVVGKCNFEGALSIKDRERL